MISVIIPSYNSETTIAQTLQSILNQDVQEPYEVIVVDSSTDKTAEIIKENFKTVKLIHLDHRIDSGTARDIGFKNSLGEIIAFIDSDCTIEPFHLRRVLFDHQSHDYAAVGGPVRNGNPESIIGWAGYVLEFSEFIPNIGEKIEVKHIPSCNISYKREVLINHGGFPSNEVLMQVDLLFNWRVSKAGGKILYDSELVTFHCHRTTLKSYLHHQYIIGIGTVNVLRRTDLQGSQLVAHPKLILFLLPMLPVVKFVRNTARFFKWDPTILLRRPLVFPLLLLGLTYWIVGFTREVYFGNKSV
jgi:O-antigen biosynthesis protein